MKLIIFMKIFLKNYTLYGVYIFSNFGFHLNRLASAAWGPFCFGRLRVKEIIFMVSWDGHTVEL